MTYPHEDTGEPTPPPEPVDAGTRRAWQVWEADLLSSAAADDAPLMSATSGAWRMAGCLMQLLAEANDANPARDRTSDGGIGDARHAATVSDHNPDADGVVRARDFDADGLDIAAAFERIRKAAAAGKLPQMVPGGYLIYAGRITAPDFSGWREYTGVNPHATHGHVSCSTDPRHYDDRSPWNVWTAPAKSPAKSPPKAPTPPPKAKPSGPGWTGPDATGGGLGFRADIGANGPRIRALQEFLRRYAPAYAKHLDVDGWYGPATASVIAEFARRSAIRNADGRNVGPQIARKLTVAGFRG